jgi:CrcB protein
LVTHWFGARLPWATVAVNVLGSMLFGVLWALTENRMPISATLRLALLTGFLGAFTTFSTFAFETVQLAQNGRPGAAVLQVLLQTGASFGAILIGLALGQALIRPV